MKASDFSMIVVIAAVSAGVAVWATNLLLGNPDDATYKMKSLSQEISSVVNEPNVDIFNVNAINPTVDVYVGSCKDIDGDGVINSVELKACNEISGD